MVALTKKHFRNRLVFLQKLYYSGYITEAEEKDLMRPITTEGNTLWCNNITSAECRRVVIITNYKGLCQIVVDSDFRVSEDNDRNLKCEILEDK